MLPKIHKEFLTKCGEQSNTAKLEQIMFGFVYWTGPKINVLNQLNVMDFIVGEICESYNSKWLSRQIRLNSQND